MPDRHEYLSRLEEEARRKLSPHDAGELVGEAAAHLGDSVQARLELGDPPHAAEAGAIAAYGSPGRVVHEALALRASRRQGHWPALFTLSALGLAVAAVIGSFLVAAPAILGLAASVCPLMASLVARPRLRPLVVAATGLWAALALFRGLCVVDLDGFPTLRSDVLGTARRLETHAALQARALEHPDLSPRERAKAAGWRAQLLNSARRHRADAERADWPEALVGSTGVAAAFAAYLALIAWGASVLRHRPQWGTWTPWREV